jgi:hypothetical protein
MQPKKQREKYKFVVKDPDQKLENEEQTREYFAAQKETYAFVTKHGIRRVAMEAADEIHSSGHSDEYEWPITLLAMDNKGRVSQIEISMEMRPKFEIEGVEELYPATVDDKTLDLPFPEPRNTP